jgi:hypothetical protein
MKAIFLGTFLVLASFAGAADTVDKVQFSGGKVLLQPGGKVLVAPNEASFPFSIVVKTNGTFTVKSGKVRSLQEGDTLGRDGMLTKADGSITPVMDHVSLNRGRVLVVRNGEASELRELLKLPDGTSIYPEGKVHPAGGTPRRLLDGENFLLEGGALPARDTITMQGGRVQVQKDGSKLDVPRDRSVMMNDGTKVFGDGRVVKADGTESKVTEGQVITLEGVVTRPR